MSSAAASRGTSRPTSIELEPTTATFEVMARRYRARRPWEIIVVETTADFGVMVGWYADLLGVRPDEPPSKPSGNRVVTGIGAAWIAIGEAGHRVVILSLPRRADDRRQGRRRWDQHVAFEYPALDDLLAAYDRLRGVGIKPFLAAELGASTAIYYEDPAGNSVELTFDHVGARGRGRGPRPASSEFAAGPMGARFDPEKMASARAAGLPVDEIHRRAYAGWFLPSQPLDPRISLSRRDLIESKILRIY
jgi:catechol 2,3-dioxygenase-like lactoylglutathione lyase family enzyme